MHILVADDSRAVRVQMRRALAGAGYSVLEATNGIEALQVAGTEPPDLAIIDIIMPSLDGFGVCDHLKRMGPPWDRMPIVFITRCESQAVELLGKQWGAYLPKPVNLDKLLEVINGLTHNREAAQHCS